MTRLLEAACVVIAAIMVAMLVLNALDILRAFIGY